MFERMGISGYIYEGVTEHSQKNLPEKITTVLVSAVKWEEPPPYQILTLGQVRDLESAETFM